MKNTHAYCVLCACVDKRKSTNYLGKRNSQENTARISRVYIDRWLYVYFVDFSVVHDAFKADQEHVVGKSVNGQLPLSCQFTMPYFPVFCLRWLCYLVFCMLYQCMLP